MLEAAPVAAPWLGPVDDPLVAAPLEQESRAFTTIAMVGRRRGTGAGG